MRPRARWGQRQHLRARRMSGRIPLVLPARLVYSAPIEEHTARDRHATFHYNALYRDRAGNSERERFITVTVVSARAGKTGRDQENDIRCPAHQGGESRGGELRPRLRDARGLWAARRHGTATGTRRNGQMVWPR